MQYFDDTPENREEVLNKLREGILNLLTINADETRRTIFATLQPTLIKPVEKKTDRVKTPNPDVQPVWDTELEEWRSFRWDRLHTWALPAAAEEINLR